MGTLRQPGIDLGRGDRWRGWVTGFAFVVHYMLAMSVRVPFMHSRYIFLILHLLCLCALALSWHMQRVLGRHVVLHYLEMDLPIFVYIFSSVSRLERVIGEEI